MSPDWIATYRLQLHAGFPLAAAEALLPYLAQLGISHVYLSPCLQPRRGSPHGYDITDPTRISGEIGGEDAWKRFCAAVRSHRLGLLLDLVPNHMATSSDNPWWDDLLAHGHYSRYAGFFDIPEDPKRPIPRLHLATLPQSYGETLESRGFTLEVSAGRPRLHCGPQHWPLHPASWSLLLEAAERAHPAFAELERLAAMAQPSGEDRIAYRQAVLAIEELWAASLPRPREAIAERLRSDPEAMAFQHSGIRSLEFT